MKWITRERPKTDRIACPWLIRRFIDQDAEIVYLPADQVLSVAEALGAHSFDAPGAEYTHRARTDGDGAGGPELCTFEVLVADFHLEADPALVELARVVHAADVSGELGTHPLGPGLSATGVGGLDVETDDQRLLARAGFVYDALYAYCRRHPAIAAAP